MGTDNLYEFQEKYFNVVHANEETPKKKGGKKKQVPYTCPRCNYNSDRRCDMVYHLFTAKRICPGVVRDMELTEEIKNSIIRNRIYHV